MVGGGAGKASVPPAWAYRGCDKKKHRVLTLTTGMSHKGTMGKKITKKGSGRVFGPF